MVLALLLWAIAFLPIPLAAALHFGLRARWTAWLLVGVAVLQVVWLAGGVLWLADYRGIGGFCEGGPCEPARGFDAVFTWTMVMTTLALVVAGIVALAGLAVAALRG